VQSATQSIFSLQIRPFARGCSAARALAVAFVGLLTAAPATAVELVPVKPPRTVVPSAEAEPEHEAKLTVRQSGSGKEPGLLKDLKGPAAMLDIDFGDHRDFRSIAGSLDVPGGQRGYVAGTGSFRGFAGTDLRVSYIGDEKGGSAVESRIARSFGDYRLTFSSTFNDGFESQFTGRGAQTAKQIFEGGVQTTAFAKFPLGAGFRETLRADGAKVLDFRTLQMAPLGATGGWLMNTTTTPLDQADAPTSGTLMYYGPLGALNITAEVDYGGIGKGVQPTEARFTAEKTFENGWVGFASASEPFTTDPGRLDVGASRQFDGFIASATAGTTSTGSAYVGLRVWLPLSDTGQDGRWFGFADAKRRMQQDAARIMGERR
jgi:hypothetical protein